MQQFNVFAGNYAVFNIYNLRRIIAVAAGLATVFVRYSYSLVWIVMYL